MVLLYRNSYRTYEDELFFFFRVVLDAGYAVACSAVFHGWFAMELAFFRLDPYAAFSGVNTTTKWLYPITLPSNRIGSNQTEWNPLYCCKVRVLEQHWDNAGTLLMKRISTLIHCNRMESNQIDCSVLQGTDARCARCTAERESGRCRRPWRKARRSSWPPRGGWLRWSSWRPPVCRGAPWWWVFIRALLHSLFHSVFHSLFHSFFVHFVFSCLMSFIHSSFVRQFVCLSVHSCMHGSICFVDLIILFIYASIPLFRCCICPPFTSWWSHSFVRSHVHAFVHLSINSVMH